MAGLDRQIDPVTKDYIANSAGGYEETESIAPAYYHRIQGRRGRWWGDKDQGSNLHAVKQKGVQESTLIFIRNEIKTAAQLFLDQGRARDLQIEAVAQGPNRICVTATIMDTQAGEIDVAGLARLND